MRALTIGKISVQTEVNIETIRYYERIGIISSPSRSERGTRQYSEDDKRRLIFIRRSRQLGFSISEIRSLLDMVDSKNYTCAEVNEIANKNLKDIQTKIRDLHKLETTLSQMVSQCSTGLVPECPVIDTLYSS